jgi:hypothetical protein
MGARRGRAYELPADLSILSSSALADELRVLESLVREGKLDAPRQAIEQALRGPSSPGLHSSLQGLMDSFAARAEADCARRWHETVEAIEEALGIEVRASPSRAADMLVSCTEQPGGLDLLPRSLDESMRRELAVDLMNQQPLGAQGLYDIGALARQLGLGLESPVARHRVLRGLLESFVPEAPTGDEGMDERMATLAEGLEAEARLASQPAPRPPQNALPGGDVISSINRPLNKRPRERLNREMLDLKHVIDTEVRSGSWPAKRQGLLAHLDHICDSERDILGKEEGPLLRHLGKASCEGHSEEGLGWGEPSGGAICAQCDQVRA